MTALLEELGHHPAAEGEVPANRLLAATMWQLVTTGRATLPGGRTLKLSEGQWLDLASKIYGQIDGPPRQDLGIEGELKQFVLGLTPEQFEKL